jgi:hypothetical protein|tara:strand:+ start:43 stop:582 length:540 start_codon:yes stop_codon:yes gene_type:complete
MTTAAHVSIKKVTPKVLEYVHSRFQYDSDLGRLISKIDSGNGIYRHKKGEIIKGEITTAGYRRIAFGKYKMREHRLIYLMCHGFLPAMLDHVDGDKLNNKIENLRACSNSQNQFNSKVPRNNTTGFKGILFNKKENRYFGRVRVSGKQYNTKRTKSLTEAVLLLRNLRENLHGEYFNHG